MVGNEWSDDHKSPKSIGGKNTQSVHVQLNVGDDIDAHCAKARAAGAEIIAEPETQFYGDRSYRAKDPEGISGPLASRSRRRAPTSGTPRAASRPRRGSTIERRARSDAGRARDRKGGVWGKRVSGRVDLGGRRLIK